MTTFLCMMSKHIFSKLVFTVHCRELEREMEKKKMTQQFIQQFKRSREEWKQKEKEKMEEENRRIMAFAASQRQREEAFQAHKKERDEALERVQKAVSSIYSFGNFCLFSNLLNKIIILINFPEYVSVTPFISSSLLIFCVAYILFLPCSDIKVF